MTSVVRTYYTYQVPRSSDKGYTEELTLLWGWAELAIGIIVGCLPVTAKFFRQFSPKVSEFFTFVSKPDARSDASTTYGPKNTDEIPKTHSSPKFQRPFARYHVGTNISESFTESFYPQTQLDGDLLHLTANKLDPTQPKSTIGREPTQSLDVIAASRPGDLESGSNRH